MTVALATVAPALGAGQPADREAEPVVSRLRDYLDERAERTGFSGNVLIAAGSRTVLRQARGMAERELGVELRPEHILPIGSLTKPITAVAALRLADRGVIDLEGGLCRYLDDCPEGWSDVTLEQLLGHTSGIPDLFGDVECAPVRDTALEIEKTLASSDTTLEEEPGSTFRYNNFGYVMLAYAMEKASGSLWENILATEVFGPAGMSETRYDDVWEIVEGRARGYELEDGRVRNVEYDDHCAYSAGGLHSTVDDLGRFLEATHRGSLLPDRYRAAAFEPRGGGFYGYGWAMRTPFGHPMRTHSGGIDGFSSAFAYLPQDELSIILLSNLEDENVNGTVCDLAALALDVEWRPMGRLEATPPSAEELDRYVGSYRPQEGEEIVISESGGFLRYARRGSSRSRALVRAEGSSFALEGAEHLRIRFEETGVSGGLTIERCGEVEATARRD